MTTKEVRTILAQIPDPEIPVISIEELGILRDVNFENDECIVTITPTYSGCPAMKAIEQDIVALLKENGIHKVKVIYIFSPAWTTDWLNDAAKEKLRKYGISPPEKTTADKSVLTGIQKIVKCPRCNSENTELVSQFGSTACKALYKCKDCLEPFDLFKCH
ncbi:MAG: putative 1,2-phenylacetyl-CoA epoxidase, subunit D [Bacteroidia bacterium]|nr:putative 1,2-phenylacetyl-CoA epoxidase, subunit D [Bacteroidia bacterium]